MLSKLGYDTNDVNATYEYFASDNFRLYDENITAVN